MSIPKEPRQQMINMMYLVLTALLALNVSAEVLNAFKLVKDGLQTSNNAVEGKNKLTMEAFANASDAVKAKPYFDDAKNVRQMTTDFITYIEGIEKELIDKSGGYEIADSSLKGKKNYDVPTRMMVMEKKGFELQDKIQELKKKLVGLPALNSLPETDKSNLFKSLTLNADFDPNNKAAKRLGKKSWAEYNFDHVPLIAVVTLLEKYKSDAKNSESAILDLLFKQISAKSYKFDDLSAKVIAPTSYVLAGTEYTSDIFVSATSSTQNPEVFIGRFNSLVKVGSDGKVQTPKTEQMPLVDGYQPLKVEGGYGKYSDKTASIGIKEVTGAIKVRKPTNDGDEFFPFKFEYTVAQAGVVVSPDKMNVFYIGVDNPVSISVPGFPAEKIAASISSGSIAASGGGGKYTVKVTQPGKANVTVSAKQMDGSSKAMGAVEFRVKRVPDPIAKIADQPGGSISTSKFKVQRGIIAVLENFDFDIRFNIVGFEMTYGAKRQDLVTARSNGPLFDSKMLDFLSRAKPGDTFYFDDIKAKGPDGTTRKLPTIAFKLI